MNVIIIKSIYFNIDKIVIIIKIIIATVTLASAIILNNKSAT